MPGSRGFHVMDGQCGDEPHAQVGCVLDVSQPFVNAAAPLAFQRVPGSWWTRQLSMVDLALVSRNPGWSEKLMTLVFEN